MATLLYFCTKSKHITCNIIFYTSIKKYTSIRLYRYLELQNPSTGDHFRAGCIGTETCYPEPPLTTFHNLMKYYCGARADQSDVLFNRTVLLLLLLLLQNSCTILALPIMDKFWSSRYLNDRLKVLNKIGSFASSATSPLVVKSGTKLTW